MPGGTSWASDAGAGMNRAQAARQVKVMVGASRMVAKYTERVCSIRLGAGCNDTTELTKLCSHEIFG
ncbi:protein of unknown function [Hyphomicrobium sp. 1Nfss2.1]